MSTSDSYLYYQAGQAVAAAHLGLPIRRLGANPALHPSDIPLPRDNPKARLILWLTGLAAEKKALGTSNPLRRARNRQRVRAHIDALIAELSGPPAKRQARARALLNQAQDRANAICANLPEAIESVAARLRTAPTITGQEVAAIVAAAKSKRRSDIL